MRDKNSNHQNSSEIDRSVSPSPRSVSLSPQTQMSQWQLSISCTGTGGLSAIEKHWKIRSSHWFDGVYAIKMVKRW